MPGETVQEVVRHRAIITVCTIGATVLQLLDQTIANVALPFKTEPANASSAPILAVPGQSEPSRKRPFVPIARLLPYGDRRAAPDKVASSRISPNLIRNDSVALARRPAQEKSGRI